MTDPEMGPRIDPWGADLDIDGVDKDTEAWLEAADNYREAEMDRQRGWAY